MLEKVLHRFVAKVGEPTPAGCLEWRRGRTFDGYGQFSFQGRTVRAHRFSYEAAKGRIPEGMMVCHTCDNPACVNPDHLVLGTHDDNMRDKVARCRLAKGRSVSLFGARNGQTKFPPETMAAIRLDPRPNAEVAKQYGVSTDYVRRVKRTPLR